MAGLAPGDRVVLTPAPPCGTCYWCVRNEHALCVNSDNILTSTFADGSTGLSRRGQVVYRGLGVGGFAEQVITQSTGAVKIPSDVPTEIACVIGCAVQTGVGAVLNTARVEEGATVLVMGAGGIGLSIVQGARLAGAAAVIVSDPVAGRREVAGRLGATHLVDPGDRRRRGALPRDHERHRRRLRVRRRGRGRAGARGDRRRRARAARP